MEINGKVNRAGHAQFAEADIDFQILENQNFQRFFDLLEYIAVDFT